MARKSAIALLVFGLLLVVIGMPAFAQDESTTTTVSAVAAPQRLEITDVNLDRYPRITMTVDLRNVPDLDPGLISVTEDGSPVADLEVSTLEQSFQRIGIVLAIDTSGSMAGEPIEAAKSAALAFIAQKRPQDWIALITFSSEVQVLSGFTNDPSALASRIDAIEAGGETAFYDAIVKSAELYTTITNDERNLIVLTDGADSIYAGDEKIAAKQAALDAVVDTGVRVFGVALEGSEFNPEDLQEFSNATEGLFRATPDPQQLSTLYGDIRRELNNKLVLRFTANQQLTTDVSFKVGYGSLSGTTTQAVPGFATTTFGTTTTTGPLVFVPPIPAAFPEPDPLAPSFTLKLASTLGVFLALTLFMLIIIRLDPDADKDSVGTRLKAYGRKVNPAPGRKGNRISQQDSDSSRSDRASGGGCQAARSSGRPQLGTRARQHSSARRRSDFRGYRAQHYCRGNDRTVHPEPHDGSGGIRSSAAAIGDRCTAGRLAGEAPIRESAARHADASVDFTAGRLLVATGGRSCSFGGS